MQNRPRERDGHEAEQRDSHVNAREPRQTREPTCRDEREQCVCPFGSVLLQLTIESVSGIAGDPYNSGAQARLGLCFRGGYAMW